MNPTCMMTSPPFRCTLSVGHDGPHATRGGYGWHDSDDVDGGVAAAPIEKEAEGTVGALIAELEHHRARAEQAEQERDEADTANAGLQAEVDRWKARAEQSRPLTPDAIADEMVRRAHAALVAQTGRPHSVATVEAVLAAARAARRDEEER